MSYPTAADAWNELAEWYAARPSKWPGVDRIYPTVAALLADYVDRRGGKRSRGHQPSNPTAEARAALDGAIGGGFDVHPAHLAVALTALDASEATVARLRTALEEAIEDMEDMILYVPDYFRTKWRYDEAIAAARSALNETRPE